MTEPPDDWGAPSLYTAGGQPFEPRTFTEADPISAVLVADWRDPDGTKPPRWGATTYAGKLRGRGARRAAVPDAHRAAAVQDQAQSVVARADAEPTDAAPGDTVPTGALPADAAPADPVPADVVQADRGLFINSRTMAVASLTSRFTGFLRSVLLVAALGRGAVGNSYSGGNTFPNMVYELLLGGVLTSVLIPLLVHAQEVDDDDGVAYAQRLLSLATAALGVLTLLAVAAAPWIAGAFVPTGSQRDLTTVFATLLLPEIFFYGLGAMFMAVLNIRHVYGPGAWSPVLNNLIMIVTLVVFWALPGPAVLDPTTITTPQVLVLGIGTTLGIVAQALVLIPSMRRSGFRWAWRFRARPNELGRMKEVGTLAGWVLGYVVASQIGVSVIQKIGFDNGGLTVFTQTDLLFQVPYGILVVSLLTAIMPRMSRAAVRGDTAAVVADLSLSARLSAVGMIPITAGLIVLGGPLAVTLFAHGATDLADGRLFGSALAMSAFGLFPFTLVMLQLRVFYAMRDGRTPTLINIFMVGTKVVLVLVTNAIYRASAGTNVNLHPSARAVEWLNISTSLSYVVGAIVGHLLLTRRLGRLGFRSVARAVGQVGLASAIGAGAAYPTVAGVRHALGAGHVGSFAALLAGAAVGLVVFWVVAARMRIDAVREVLTLAGRR